MLIRTFIISVLMLGGAACTAGEQPACADARASSSDFAPSIDAFQLVGSLEDDPWTQIFRVAFSDSNGDLGEFGRAEVFLNSGSEPVEFELSEFFFQGGLPLDATSGALGFPLRFDEATAVDGAQAKIGLMLLDGNSFRSNCYSLDLQFSVSSLSN